MYRDSTGTQPLGNIVQIVPREREARTPKPAVYGPPAPRQHTSTEHSCSKAHYQPKMHSDATARPGNRLRNSTRIFTTFLLHSTWSYFFCQYCSIGLPPSTTGWCRSFPPDAAASFLIHDSYRSRVRDYESRGSGNLRCRDSGSQGAKPVTTRSTWEAAGFARGRQRVFCNRAKDWTRIGQGLDGPMDQAHTMY
jgi:hypothetical protein